MGRIRNIRFVGNSILSIRANFLDNDMITVTSSVNRTQCICVLFSPPVIYIIIESYQPSWLSNGTTYGGEILHADPCRTWPTHGLSQILLRGHPFERSSLFLKFCSHVSSAAAELCATISCDVMKTSSPWWHIMSIIIPSGYAAALCIEAAGWVEARIRVWTTSVFGPSSFRNDNQQSSGSISDRRWSWPDRAVLFTRSAVCRFQMSRVGTPGSLYVLAKDRRTKNVVYQNALL